MSAQFRPELEAGARAMYNSLRIDQPQLSAEENQTWRDREWPGFRDYYCRAFAAGLAAVPVSADLVMAMHGKSTPIPATKGSKLYESFQSRHPFSYRGSP